MYRNSLAVQWLGLHTFAAEGAGSVPGQGTKILQAVRHGPPKKLYVTTALNKQECMD